MVFKKDNIKHNIITLKLMYLILKTKKSTINTVAKVTKNIFINVYTSLNIL